MLKKLALMSAVSAFAMTTALAQTPSPSQPGSPPAATQEAPKSEMKAGGAQFIASQKPDQLLASTFKVGDVSDILFDKTGKIEAYVVSVGGFLGIGSKDVALAPTAFQMMPGDPNSVTDRSPKLKISMTQEQLKEAANFEPYKEPRATTGAGGGTPRPGGTGGGMK
jgi:hypothetical protein